MQYLEKDSSPSVLVGPLVDVTDGSSPESDITLANATCNIITGVTSASVTLVASGATAGQRNCAHVASGFYKIDLSDTDTDTTGDLTIVLKDVDEFVTSWQEFTVVASDAYGALTGSGTLDELDTIQNRLGGITGTGSNTVLGFFQAALSKSATTPTDIGGTFNPLTDSQESLDGVLANIKGAGFSSAADSLFRIAQLVRALESTGTGGAGSGTGTVTSTVVAGHFLDRVISEARRYADEPSVNAKYSEAVLIEKITTLWTQLWTDLSLTMDSPIVVRHDITVVSGQQNYLLPPTVGEILSLRKIDTNTDLPTWESWPQSYYNPYGPGVTVEGNMIRFTPIWNTGETLRLEYTPSGETYPHEGGCTVLGSSSLIIGGTPSAGSLDTRENAYAGYVIRLFHAETIGRTQERIVDTFDPEERSIVPTVDFTGTTAELTNYQTYELVPVFSRLVESVLSVAIARDMVASTTNKAKFQALTQIYKERIRAARTKLMKLNQLRVSRFEGDVSSNPNFVAGTRRAAY
jgi:hypothetical protein